MRARLVVACSALLVVLALWMVGAGGRRTSAQEAARPAKKHFLEVGKKYAFSYAIARLDVKILAEPRDRWVKVDLA